MKETKLNVLKPGPNSSVLHANSAGVSQKAFISFWKMEIYVKYYCVYLQKQLESFKVGTNTLQPAFVCSAALGLPYLLL